MEKFLVVYPDLCTGCRLCEAACSYRHEGVYSPSLSRVRVVKFEDRCLSVPVVCNYCEQPPCEASCPTGAMSAAPDGRYALVREDRCIGCKECVHACPLGAVHLHPRSGVAIRCDLCRGDPECVKVCTAGALRYEPLEAAVREKRRARAASLNPA